MATCLPLVNLKWSTPQLHPPTCSMYSWFPYSWEMTKLLVVVFFKSGPDPGHSKLKPPTLYLQCCNLIWGEKQLPIGRKTPLYLTPQITTWSNKCWQKGLSHSITWPSRWWNSVSFNRIPRRLWMPMRVG